MNVLKAREEAFRLSQMTYQEGTPIYTEYSPIYLASTSNVKDTMALYGEKKDVLTVGGTGAHAYEALLRGAEHVDCFDVNFLQKIYFEYMKTAIMYLSYEEFMKCFTLPKQDFVFKKRDITDLLSNESFDRLSPFLSDDVLAVLGPVYDFSYSSDVILSSLFRFEHPVYQEYLKRYVSFYNEEEYYKLQKILRERDAINYQVMNLTDVPQKLSSKYDLIVLDNILQYYKNIKGLETPYEVNLFLNKKLSSLLKEDGEIQATYGFSIATDAFKDKFHIPYQKRDFLGELMIAKEKKEGIAIPLVDKWGYHYDFIPGVEQAEGSPSENVVLTYKKKK